MKRTLLLLLSLLWAPLGLAAFDHGHAAWDVCC
jgi:hypothetical protein